ncbi:GSU2403 family nucleotidyltransferase fold protein [Chlamydiales bacterium]|nr:GSU2403 family nucleotidyltransferase fold protein [Chlamydiales bacterium]
MTENFKKEDIIISEFLRSVGPWKEYIVIGGGYALIIYKLYFSDSSSINNPIGTRDIDSLISRRIPEASIKDIAKHLQDAGFEKIYKDYDKPATEAYIKEINQDEVEIEFLTDSNTRGDKQKNVKISGVIAQPLQYLSLSINKTLSFKTHSDEPGFVVSPGAWILHKGLTFKKRKDKPKSYKDLYGIWYVTTQLGDFSIKALKEFYLLENECPKWVKRFRDNLSDWIENASPSDWSKLEMQEPSGDLTRARFKVAIEYLLKEQHNE